MNRTIPTPSYNLRGAGGQATLRRYCSSLIVFSLTLFIFHLLTSGAAAQTTTSTIEGTVTDANGAVIAGAEVKANGTTLAAERSVIADAEGFYRLTALPAGTYTLTVARTGFASSTSNIELTLNRVVTFDVQLQVGSIVGGVTNVASDALPLLEPNASSTGLTVTPKQIQDLPVNGRDYLDLLQLVPGVAINRQAAGGDNANPVLGERSGNNSFLIDGHSNKDTVNGGPAAQFNQETIAEFQVLTTGYKAEFGQASGAIVNVITKSGGNEFHGVGSFFHRNEAFDSINSLDKTLTEAPKLRRFDYSLAGGGPIWKDRIFFFGSSERITEDRQIDFDYPDLGASAGAATALRILRNQEDPLDGPTRSREIRNFFKLNEQFGRHSLVQEVNYTNGYVRGAGAGGLPSTRDNSRARRLLLAFGDTILVGDKSDPFIVTLRAAYRDEPSGREPSQPQVGAFTFLNLFSFFPPSIIPTDPFPIFGDLPQVFFGNANTASNLNQKYTSFTANANKLFGDHDVKFGWNFLRTKVDGLDSQVLVSQIFTTIDDFATFGPLNSGYTLIGAAGGLTPEDNEIHLRNNYNALYVQDDWKLRSNLTVNLGLRYDHDSEFDAKRNFSPRLGVAWAVTPKTVIRAHFGKFYDQFRLGLVGQIPAFGGSDRRFKQSQFFPRGFYGSPSFVSSVAFLFGFPGGCFANGITGNLTDAQIAATGATCPFGIPMIGVDRLNRVVAPGRPPIPANTVINISNIQALTGLTPQQYVDQASAAIGQPAGYFRFGAFGVLEGRLLPAQTLETAVDGTFQTPHTLSFSAGVQREITKDMIVEVDYFHREMRNLLGVRNANLGFRARVLGRFGSFDPPNTEEAITTFGPFFEGKYDAVVASFNKRLSNRYQVGANYTFARATDNSLGIFALPSDSFIGVAPVLVDPGGPGCPGGTNANGSFTSCSGNFVAQAGTFVNGPDLDKGPSDLALDHIFQVNGLVELPWKFQVSGIFRAQSGFHFSRVSTLSDPDGDGTFIGVDTEAGRNAFTSPSFVNLDMRFSKRFDIGERVRVDLFFEYFNLFNRQNPSVVQDREGVSGEPFNSIRQVLPGREGQVGIRVSF